MGWSDSEVGFDDEAGKKTDKEEGKTYLLKIVCLFYEQYSTLGYILDIEISKFWRVIIHENSQFFRQSRLISRISNFHAFGVI